MKIIAIASLVLLAGCPDPEPAIQGTQGLKVEITSPTDLGTLDNRLPGPIPSVTVNITALDVDGNVDPTFNNQLRGYVNFLGTLTPYLCDPASAAQCNSLVTVPMVNGTASNIVVPLPAAGVFGPATIWFDDGYDMAPTYATGASDTIWFRDPFIVDTQKPVDESALDALTRSPLVDVNGNGKQVDIRHSRYGDRGKLVVTSVFAQGYTLADVQCADNMGTPPCTSQDYDYELVFSFSAAKDGIGCFLAEGQVIQGFAGGMSDFDGLTEVGFPQSFVDHGQGGGCTDGIVINSAMEPTPVKFDPTWFTQDINFERNEAGAIEVDGAALCDIDADTDFATFNQWKVDPAGVGGDCSGNKNVINVISAGVVQGIDATLLRSLKGQTIPKVIGMLRPINIGSFNVWIIYPRGDADVQLH